MGEKFSLFDAMNMYRPKAGMAIGSQDIMNRMSTIVRNNFPHPLMATWLCNAKCNYKCFYCPLSKPDYQPKEDELTTEQAKLLIEKVKESGVEALIINGGEPFLREDLPILIEYANNIGLEVSVSTNLSLFNPDLINRCKIAGLKRVIVSLDTPSKDNYHKNKGVDCFDEILRKIQDVKKAGIDVTATIGITKENETEFEDFVELSIRQKISTIIVWFPIADRDFENKVLTPLERHNFMEKIYYLSKEKYDEINLLCHPCDGQWIKALLDLSKKDRHTLENLRFKMISNMSKGCQAATYVLGLSLEGNIFPCGATMGDKGDSLGNIFTDSLLEIWNESEIFKKIRHKEIKGKCGECDFVKSCGGCRVLAWLTTGDYLESDPSCIYSAVDPNSTSDLVSR